MMKFWNLDWGTWIYGAMYAFVSAGSGSILAGFTAAYVDPEHFNISNPKRILELLGGMFLFAAVPAFFGFLRQNPLPKIITTTTDSITVKRNPPTVTATSTTTTTETK